MSRWGVRLVIVVFMRAELPSNTKFLITFIILLGYALTNAINVSGNVHYLISTFY